MFRNTVGNVHNLFIIYCNMKLEVLLNVCIKVFSYNLSGVKVVAVVCIRWLQDFTYDTHKLSTKVKWISYITVEPVTACSDNSRHHSPRQSVAPKHCQVYLLPYRIHKPQLPLILFSTPFKVIYCIPLTLTQWRPSFRPFIAPDIFLGILGIWLKDMLN